MQPSGARPLFGPKTGDWAPQRGTWAAFAPFNDACGSVDAALAAVGKRERLGRVSLPVGDTLYHRRELVVLRAHLSTTTPPPAARARAARPAAPRRLARALAARDAVDAKEFYEACEVVERVRRRAPALLARPPFYDALRSWTADRLRTRFSVSNAWGAAAYVGRRRVRRTTVIDLACGHGLAGVVLAAAERRVRAPDASLASPAGALYESDRCVRCRQVTRVFCVDERRPQSYDAIIAAAAEACAQARRPGSSVAPPTYAAATRGAGGAVGGRQGDVPAAEPLCQSRRRTWQPRS